MTLPSDTAAYCMTYLYRSRWVGEGGPEWEGTENYRHAPATVCQRVVCWALLSQSHRAYSRDGHVYIV